MIPLVPYHIMRLMFPYAYRSPGMDPQLLTQTRVPFVYHYRLFQSNMEGPTAIVHVYADTTH